MSHLRRSPIIAKDCFATSAISMWSNGFRLATTLLSMCIAQLQRCERPNERDPSPQDTAEYIFTDHHPHLQPTSPHRVMFTLPLATRLLVMP